LCFVQESCGIAVLRFRAPLIGAASTAVQFFFGFPGMLTQGAHQMLRIK
jgi:hypothetical protein